MGCVNLRVYHLKAAIVQLSIETVIRAVSYNPRLYASRHDGLY